MIKFWKNSHKHIGYIAFGIAVITAFLFSLFELSECCIQCYSQAMLNNKKFDFTVTDISRKQQENIVRYCSDRKIEGYFSYSEADTIYIKNSTEPYVLAGISGNSQKIGNLNIIQGKKPTKSNEVCIEKSANEDFEKPYSIGDTISTQIGKSKTQLKIVGFTSEFSFNGNYIFYNNGISNDFVVKKNKLNFVQILVNDNYDDENVSELVMETRRNIKGLSSNNIVWNESKVDLYNDRGSYQSISLAIKSLNIVVLICGIIFLSGEMYNLYLFRKSTYKIMRCLGLSINKIVFMLAKELLVLGGIGMLLGFIAGVFLNQLVIARILQCFFSSSAYNHYIPNAKNVFLCIGIVVGIMFLSICTLYFHLRETQPIDTDKTQQIVKKRPKGKKAYHPQNMSVLIRYILNKSKLNNLFSMLQFLIIAFSFFLSMVVVTVVAGYQKQNLTLDQAFPLQISVGADGSKMVISQKKVTQIQHLEGVSEVCTEYAGGDLYSEIEGRKIKTVIYSDSLMKKIDLNEQEAIGSAIYIGSSKSDVATLSASDDFAKKCKGLKSNTTIKVKKINKTGSYYFAKDYEKEIVIIGRKYAEQLGIPNSLYNTVCAKIKGDFQQTKQVIVQSLGGANQLFVYDNYSQVKTNLMIQGMIALACYIVVILIFSIISILLLSYHYRYVFQYKELGILRAMGLSIKNVSFVFGLSGGIVTAKAIIVSCVFAFPFTKWLLDTFYGQVNSNIGLYFLMAFIYLLFVFGYGVIVFQIYNKNLTVSNQLFDGE